jgi:hypothetical protein
VRGVEPGKVPPGLPKVAHARRLRAERRKPAGLASAIGHIFPGFAVEVYEGMPNRLFDAMAVNQPIAILNAILEFVVVAG